MTFRAGTDSHAYLTKSTSKARDHSATWPTAAEQGHVNIDPGPPGSSVECAPSRPERSDYFEPEDRDTMQIFAALDRHDTIPSPPPELESAPWHEEL
jgi:hypothetical protein